LNGFHKQLYDFIEPLAEGLPVIFSYQNAARIDKAYISLRIDTVRLPSNDIYLIVDENGIARTSSWRTAIVELQTFGAGAGDMARRFAQKFRLETTIQSMQRLDIAIGNRLFLSEVPALLNLTQYEERGIFQFEFMFTEEMDDDVGLIETVEIEGRTTGSLADHTLGNIRISVTAPQVTMWDDGETGWDNNRTTWWTTKQQQRIFWDDLATTRDNNRILWWSK